KKPAWQPLRFAVEEGGHIVAAASILKRKLPKVNRCIFYCARGPILDYDDEELLCFLCDRLRAEGRKHRAILLKIDPAIRAERREVVARLQRIGFIPVPDAPGGFGGTQPRCVMPLNIARSEEELLASFHQKWRYNIRLAERKGVTVKSDCTREDVRTFYQILQETAQRDGFRVRDLSYFERMWDELVPHGRARLFLAFYQGEPIAGAFNLLLGDKCWYLYGASSNRHRNVMPNHLVQWTAIRWAKAQGCRIYDFRGVAPQKTADQTQDATRETHLEGLNRFKAGFGAEYVEYIGEFDWPLSRFWYWLWTVGKPLAVRLLKQRKGQAGPQPVEE
ncbi:MAG: peptidoglycan bridge formation glycyltransferase FemA/FemB family protein, partial [Abditibacteriales bacterium]|nr:peptidoglycan bridge formation glycyltransferase FemA/FemB family protein [Abditibacteriales bacterium]